MSTSLKGDYPRGGNTSASLKGDNTKLLCKFDYDMTDDI